jgi:NADPH:quinone reductase-like Zn-dependent oxidoreductase
VIDYHSGQFEDDVSDVNVVFDGVGGTTLEPSWDVLTPPGRMVTIAADSEGTQDERTKAAFFVVEPNQQELSEIALRYLHPLRRPGPRAFNPWLVALAVVVPDAFMEVLDTTIANVALRYIAGGLSSAVTDSEWVITSYLAAE